jgi:hypothetical protein
MDNKNTKLIVGGLALLGIAGVIYYLTTKEQKVVINEAELDESDK